MSEEQTPADQPDYEVGYGKPPREHRFKPDNKFGKGRKKGAKGIKTIVNEVYGEKIATSLGGKTKKRPTIEVTIRQVANRGLKGDGKASDKGIALYERYGPQEDDGGPPPEKLERDMAAVRHYLAMHDQRDGAGTQEEPRSDD
jgi:hypothetical protein